jgi:fibrillarin-like pre-rRNA processing protein
VYQDIAQRDQAGIFVKNCDLFLKDGGFSMLAVKARSVDITKNPRLVFNEVQAKLMEHLEIVDKRTLEPYEKDHCLFLCKRK